MINAAMTPGIHPHAVNKSTIITEPQPLSKTASGGKKMDNKTLQILILLDYKVIIKYYLIRLPNYFFVT
ncbi:hypothetical protein GCM10022393_37460 [Aquimarina addita]|uniref:Uncharacterized protein n=1 Tax=Aquimarina addita TaxID=870485 RepID=A0ABP6UU72_9FLAO